MRRLLASASLLAATAVAAPMAAVPAEVAAQAQFGLVNVNILDDENNVEVLSRNHIPVAAAVPIIVQACDLIDVGEANLLVVNALSGGSPVTSACDQAGTQTLTITQSTEQRGGGRR